MDYATIIVACMSLVGTLVGSFLSNSKSSALIAYRLEELEKKVQKHNNLVERMALLERDFEQMSNTVNNDSKELRKLREETHHD